jgi:hypothetical protein
VSSGLCIAHQTAERTRLQLTARPPAAQRESAIERLQALGDALEAAIDDESGLLQMDIRPMTGSLVIEHPGIDGAAVVSAVVRVSGELEDRPVAETRPGLTPLFDAVAAADRGLRESSGGSADLRAIVFLLLVSLAIAQMLRGQVMAPATALLWYAFDILRFPPTETD